MEEILKNLLSHKNVKINKIISPPNFVSKEFIQDEDEWVTLLEGSAILEINQKTTKLVKDSHIFIPAKTPHKIISTDPKIETIWLAIHIY
ncbi:MULTISPECIES: cupin domain-containing protein [Okeania]|uniref:Cupin domain-containing protein n=1 Tax=Okeania hirsuta TaxID=1458930 RepID=A0A3N6NIH5_9CYAN|nr:MULTISPECIES: cupin domain-containing protein [Okeania]NEP04178.1 cupin domain-containing protein [Okeania sp. SIO4D6]NEP41269.1 cupin domain-containing protein [Okeania sp. SIO2H7]NET13812.1 cupin domain-containing protein [Okeania sp. SIO1H6]NEP71667.1 cupin domain-containing protein [Okeania sp. SIO2G5]NEP91762.1 cupin domain-containing protein [Okeania sp. SIO2F5]